MAQSERDKSFLQFFLELSFSKNPFPYHFKTSFFTICVPLFHFFSLLEFLDDSPSSLAKLLYFLKFFEQFSKIKSLFIFLLFI